MTGYRKRIIVQITVLVLALAVLAGVGYLLRFVRYQQAIDRLSASESIVLEQVPDGTYTGECDTDFIYARVAVTVKQGIMTKIELLEHRNERGAPAERILQDMVEQQSMETDTVTGATNSCRVIKQAVVNALLGPLSYA